MDFLFFFFIFFLIYLLLILLRVYSKPKEYNPFELVEMTVAIQCKKCNWKKFTAFERGDYVFKVITDDRAKHENCDGEVEILGIFFERKNSIRNTLGRVREEISLSRKRRLFFFIFFIQINNL